MLFTMEKHVSYRRNSIFRSEGSFFLVFWLVVDAIQCLSGEMFGINLALNMSDVDGNDDS